MSATESAMPESGVLIPLGAAMFAAAILWLGLRGRGRRLEFDGELLRKGSNQFGWLAMLSALVAHFIDPVPGVDKWWLFFIGFVVYFLSLAKLKPETRDDDSSGGNYGN